MNILISSYSANPYHGSEDGIGWHWALELSKKFNKSDDKIYFMTKKCNAADTARGIKEFGLDNVELVISDTPDWLNWYREKDHSPFHHMYYILWQNYAYHRVKKSGIHFDIIHHVTMGDFRILSKMYKFNDSYTVFGPVGGGQSTPKALKGYEKYPLLEKFREFINKSRTISPKYKKGINKFNKVYAINSETADIMSKAMGKKCDRLFELALADEFKNLDIKARHNEVVQITFVGRLIEKKGLMLLLDAINAMPKDLNYMLNIYGDGTLAPVMEQFINSNNLQNKVTLHGNVDHTEISKAYMDADMFVMPSLRETSGNVIIEAMAHKLPVIALDMSISSDLKQYDCGEFVNVNQTKDGIINEFASKLQYLITHPDKRIEYGNNGYNYVNNNLSWEDKVNTIYKDFLDER